MRMEIQNNLLIHHSRGKDYPAGSSVGITRQSGKSKRKQLGKKDLKEDGVRVITLKLDNLFQLSEDDSEKSPKGSKGSSGGHFFSNSRSIHGKHNNIIMTVIR